LTDVGYSRRLKDLFAHQTECTEEELHLLKYGRHFRLNPQAKLIVGRTREDNENILKYHNLQTDTLIDVRDYASPITLIPRGGSKDVIYLAGSICVAYSKASNLIPVDVVVKTPQGQETIQVIGIPTADFKKLLI
jgi:predicted ribosome quality control (RQC) complex YloA/Tae2 family protein